VKKDERDFYLWLHNTLKIKDRKREKKNSQNNSNKMDYIAAKIEEVENKIAEFDIENIMNNLEITYKSEPINNNSNVKREQLGETNLIFDKMRKIGKESTVGFYFDDYYTKQFYEQAIFMKDYEDDFDQVIEFDSYRPIYAYMDNLQLRTYFTWRTKVRKGVIDNINWSYVQIYIYEIINGISNTSIKESLNIIIKLWTEYRKFDKTVDRYFSNCVKDYYICNDFKCSYNDIIEKLPIKDNTNDINKEAIMDKKYEGMMQYINSISSYKVTESIFFNSESGELVEHSIPYVFRELDKYFEISNIDFTQILIGKPTNNTWWKPFRNAVYHESIKMKDKVVEVSRTEKYIYKLGRWKSVTYDGGIKYRKLIGFILKAVESKVRELVRFKYKLKPNIDAAAVDYFTDKNLVSAIRNKSFLDAINRGVENYLAENNIVILKKAANKIEQKDIIKRIEAENRVDIILDTSKFDEIRKTAELIQDKLIIEDNIENLKDKIVEDNEIDKNKEKDKDKDKDKNIDKDIDKLTFGDVFDDEYGQNESSDNQMDKSDVLKLRQDIESYEEQSTKENTNIWMLFAQGLTDAERDVITTIINGKDIIIEINVIAKRNNQLIEVIIEAINEKAIDLIGDNIIDINNEIPYVYEDYVIDIGNVLLKGEEYNVN
jgi:hypothetical protein